MAITDTTPPQQKQSWIASNKKILVALFVVIIVVVASIGLIYTQKLSKIKILARNASSEPASYSFLIDGAEVATGNIWPGNFCVIGVFPVETGVRTVEADCHYLGDIGVMLDGVYEYSFDYSVGPLYTKSVWIQLTPEIPNLVGDLTLHHDDDSNEVSVEGKVSNYANVSCFGTLTFEIQDLRGWIKSDTVLLGRFDADTTFIEVSETYVWPNYYEGQYNTGLVPVWHYTVTFS